LARVIIAVLQTAVLPSFIEDVQIDENDNPVPCEGRLLPGLLAPADFDDKPRSEVLSEALKSSVRLKERCNQPYGSGDNLILTSAFEKLNKSFETWLFNHVSAQIEALLHACGNEMRPDVVVLPEYAVSADCVLKLKAVVEREQLTIVAGTHAWSLSEWNSYPLLDYLDQHLRDQIQSKADQIADKYRTAYFAVCPILSKRGNTCEVDLVPKLLPSTYERNLSTFTVPEVPERRPYRFQTRNGRDIDLARFICSEFIRDPDQDNPAERIAHEGLQNGQRDAALITIPAYTPVTTDFENKFEAHLNRVSKPRIIFALANIATYGVNGHIN